MACDYSYSVLIIPLQNSLYSPDALHCFHWLKRRRDLERQKDVLWAGLQVVEQAQLWYHNRLQLNLQRHVSFSTGDLDGEGTNVSITEDAPSHFCGNECRSNVSVDSGFDPEFMKCVHIKGNWSCALRSCMQRVNGSLGSLMSDSCVWNNLAPEESGGSDWDLRWSNASLVKEVNRRNQQISMLELEKTRLQQLVSYSTSD